MEQATYAAIAQWIKQTHGFTVKPCWIADAKERCGIPLRDAANRVRAKDRKHPCPPSKFPILQAAFRRFGML